MASCHSVRRHLLLASAVVVGAIIGTARTSFAQGGGGPPQQQPYENLKYFSKDLPRDSLFTIMRGFTYALGVNCAFCHVEEEPAQAGGRPRLKPALDDKVEKRTARFMLTMVDTLNSVTLAKVPQRHEAVKITCVTCHRGVAIPKQLTAIMMETAGKDGVAKALQQYQDLRKQYYGAQAYDFTDASLFNAANQSLTANKPDDAIAFAQLNLAYNARSARSYQVMSQAYQRKNDKDKAIQALEKAVEIDPMNQGFKNQLQQLKAGA